MVIQFFDYRDQDLVEPEGRLDKAGMRPLRLELLLGICIFSDLITGRLVEWIFPHRANHVIFSLCINYDTRPA